MSLNEYIFTCETLVRNKKNAAMIKIKTVVLRLYMNFSCSNSFVLSFWILLLFILQVIHGE